MIENIYSEVASGDPRIPIENL